MRYGYFLALMMVMVCGHAHADNLLAIAPLRLILTDVKPSDMLMLTNRSDATRTYKIVVEDQVMTPSGSIIQQDGFAYSAKRMLRFMPRQVTLGPGQRQNIRVMASAPADLATGDYHSHMIFEEQKPEPTGDAANAQLKVAMESVYSVGIPVIVQHGTVDSSLKIGGAVMASKNGRAIVNVTMLRTGNAEASALVQVVDKASSAAVGQSRMLHMYREVETMEMDMALPADGSANGKALSVRLVNDGKILQEMDVAR